MEVDTHLLRTRLTSILCAGNCHSEHVIAISVTASLCVVSHICVCIYIYVDAYVFSDIRVLMFPPDLRGGTVIQSLRTFSYLYFGDARGGEEQSSSECNMVLRRIVSQTRYSCDIVNLPFRWNSVPKYLYWYWEALASQQLPKPGMIAFPYQAGVPAGVRLSDCKETDTPD